ncbi:hypothetical protein ACH5RR_036036 [Cinchona calisaya]|uniref:DDRGK domain-containing protein 1 n=1 Tax=Cinchona calisaya TaxID=153742 RepID=A0ABD2Y6S7_9GENT
MDPTMVKAQLQDVEKQEKINGLNYKRWSMKIFYQLTITKVAYVLSEAYPQDEREQSNEEISANQKSGLKMTMSPKTVDESDEEAAGDGYYAAKADEAARESRLTKQDHYEEMRRKNDKEREAQELKLFEEAKARKAEEEVAALEFEKWKGEFSVDAEGTTENEVQDGGLDLLSGFVDYIKNHKCIPLEDLVAEFKLRTQDCINRITSLEDMGRLSRVMDDRGKYIYIYISQEEMNAVVDNI